jgi:hypothetical protein
MNLIPRGVRGARAKSPHQTHGGPSSWELLASTALISTVVMAIKSRQVVSPGWSNLDASSIKLRSTFLGDGL